MVRLDGTRRDDRLGHQGWRGQHRRALLDQTDRRNCMRVVWARALATSSSQRRVGLDGTKRGTGKRAAAGRRFVSLLSGAPGIHALARSVWEWARGCVRGSSCAINCTRTPFMRARRATSPHNRSYREIALKTYWWLGAESNHRHADFQSAALPTELPSQGGGLYAARWGRANALGGSRSEIGPRPSPG
jgi:hypothetical protein